MFLRRFSGLPTGPVFGHGGRDGQRWITRSHTVLERSPKSQGHGAQVGAPFVAMSSESADRGPLGRISHWLVTFPQIALSGSGRR